MTQVSGVEPAVAMPTTDSAVIRLSGVEKVYRRLAGLGTATRSHSAGLVPLARGTAVPTLDLSEGGAMAMSGWRRLVSRFRREQCPQCGRPVRQLHCDVCGYDLIAQTRDKAFKSR